jgi:hypothetical protein
MSEKMVIKNGVPDWVDLIKEEEPTWSSIFVIPLDAPQPDVAFAPSDDSSSGFWTSQKAVKFNKKPRPKADGFSVKECSFHDNCSTGKSSKTKTRSVCSSEYGQKSLAGPGMTGEKNQSLSSFPQTTSLDEERRSPSGSPSPSFSEADLSSWEKRDEIEAEFCDGAFHEEPFRVYPNIGSSVMLDQSSEGAESDTIRMHKKSVRFSKPLVTAINYRPKTLPAEVSLLFFDEDELEILEEDRETTSRDQFEMIAQELSENRLRISIAYQNRWREKRTQTSSSDLQVVTSTSDI